MQGVDIADFTDSYNLGFDPGTRDVFGTAAGEELRGLFGSNHMYGYGGDDRIHGFGGDDYLYGGDGNDLVGGGVGNDELYGGRGNDRLLGADGQDVLNGEDGDDYLNGGEGDDVLRGGNGNGGDGTDYLWGGEGNDTLDGGLHDDVLFGGAGTDTLTGGDGTDVLFGGAGSDRLTGGAGVDIFIFDTALGSTNVDTITDFRAGTDGIVLDLDIFSRLSEGTLSASAFRAGTSASTTSQRIIHDSSTDSIWYDADGSGSQARVLFAKVAAGKALTAASFEAYRIDDYPEPELPSLPTASGGQHDIMLGADAAGFF